MEVKGGGLIAYSIIFQIGVHLLLLFAILLTDLALNLMYCRCSAGL